MKKDTIGSLQQNDTCKNLIFTTPAFSSSSPTMMLNNESPAFLICGSNLPTTFNYNKCTKYIICFSKNKTK